MEEEKKNEVEKDDIKEDISLNENSNNTEKNFNNNNMVEEQQSYNNEVLTNNSVENNDFGEEKSSKGIVIAVVLVIAVVAILFLIKGCKKDEKYTIKFDTNGGNEITEQVVQKDDKVKTPQTPTRDGYKFVGWYYEDKVFDFNTNISSNMVIEARWEKVEENVKVTGVSLDQSDVTLKIKETLQLNATVSPNNAKNKEITWSSSDSDIVTVDDTGLITAKKKGTATIKVVTNDGNYEATCKVTVASDVVKVTGISLDKTSATVGINNTITLKATVKPNDASNKGVTWKSSDTSIATVDNGKVKGIKEGKVTITATTKDGNHSATATITVKKIKVTGVTLNTTSKTIAVGDTYTLKATVKPSDASDKGVTWKSSDTSIVTVSGGKIKGIKEGKATITVTTKDGNYSATATITVNPAKVTKVTITGNSTVAVKKSITLKASVTATGNADKTVKWTSSDTTIATVNNKGVVTGVKAGTVTITATAGGVKATKKVTVTASTVKLNLTIKFTTVCSSDKTIVQGYKYTVYNNGKAYNDYKAIIINGTPTPKGKQVSPRYSGKQNIVVDTNDNGKITISATLPTKCS